MTISGPASNEAYLWRQIPNQGFNLYGKGIIGPGSRESLDRAVNLHAGDGKTTTQIEVLSKPTHINNRWGGYGTDYLMQRGDLRMTYGPQSVDWMDARWQKYAKSKGLTQLVDQAGSVDVALMESTHREAIPIGNGQFKPGEYLTGKLRTPGTSITAIKDANIGITIPTEDMTHVLTSEAKATGAAPTRLKPGMVIAHDALGVYTPPLKTVLKKNQPVDAAGKAVHAKLTKFARIQNLAQTYAKEGHISPQSAERFIGKAWQFVMKFGKCIR